MLLALIVAFIVVHVSIALEHHEAIVHQLRETIGSTAGIIFFLIGAMTIVEVIDAHDGFREYQLADQDEEVDHV